jgi:hypothetical protein
VHFSAPRAPVSIEIDEDDFTLLSCLIYCFVLVRQPFAGNRSCSRKGNRRGRCSRNGSDELSAEALREAQYLPFDETLDVRVVRPENLAAEALKIGRPKDLGRISQLLAADEFDLERFSDLVKRFGLEQKWAKIEPLLAQE